jgi:hypothetical protein
VSVTASGSRIEKNGLLPNSETLAGDLAAVLAEFDNRDLNAMLPPAVIPSPLGMATYILERLLLHNPSITAIAISDVPGEDAAVHRELPGYG